MTNPDELEAGFWRMFSQVMGKPISPGSYDKEQLSEWDSLRHIELVFALEESFGVSVSRDRIAELYSDTDFILAFLREQSAKS
jgi:acyl carrier protein